jgi:D-alanyl-D-alanine carboxypeptidase
MTKEKSQKTNELLVVTVLVLAVSLVGVLASRFEIRADVVRLQSEMEQQQVAIFDYEDTIAKQEQQLDAVKELLRVVRQNSVDTAYDFSQIRAMVSQATQTVEDIRKLEEADEELLAKYSKVYFLNEHYSPDNLAYIPRDSVVSGRELQIKGEVLPFLKDMFDAMQARGLSPRVISAFRSFGYQGDLKSGYTMTYGTNVSSQFVADQGYSEHQLGTTVDIVNEAIGSDMREFSSTPEYQWLLKNAYTYGFILSYPEDNSYYAFEPWHWRFVGVALATDLARQGKYFYDLAQRDINSYRITMFDTPR